jgi:hypothetical protein
MKALKAFSSYVRHLDRLVARARQDGTEFIRSAPVHAALNGEPNDQLRRLVSREDLRAAGAFFTSSELADHALAPFLDTLTSQSVILDPACGAGDLLLKCAARLFSSQSLDKTLTHWGAQLVGRDLQPEFVKAARSRLLLQALSSIQIGTPAALTPERTFPNLEARCGLSDTAAFASATHVVLNPPFNQVAAPSDCHWAAGKVNAAALFLAACLKYTKPGTKVLAILPEALRSGTRYQKWRRLVETHSLVKRVEPYGQFDAQTDIDVFILEIEIANIPKQAATHQWFPVASNNKSTIGDLFDVSIGPVVDYRDPRRGRFSPFLCARDLPAWQILRGTKRTRQFQGRRIHSPFVVVRRTSRPSDKYRATATIVSLPSPAAVENHLIILSPKDGTIKQCRALLKVLKHSQTSQWLNQRIRCRHLTASSLASLPWPSGNYD